MSLEEISDLRFFVDLVNAGGITSAALRFGVTPPSVSRRLSKIEKRLGIKLIERNTRHFHLNDHGHYYYEKGSLILSDIDDLDYRISSSDKKIEGFLSIGAPLELGSNKIAPFVEKFAKKYPNINVNLAVATEGSYNFDDYLDIIIRIGLPESSSAIVTKIASTIRVPCASPEYIRIHGEPKSPQELQQHTCLCLRRYKTMEAINQWLMENNEESFIIKVEPKFSSTSAEIIHRWALSGNGIAYKLYWDLSESLQTGKLVRILPNYNGEIISLYAVLPSKSYVKRSVRIFLDELKLFAKDNIDTTIQTI